MFFARNILSNLPPHADHTHILLQYTALVSMVFYILHLHNSLRQGRLYIHHLHILRTKRDCSRVFQDYYSRFCRADRSALFHNHNKNGYLGQDKIYRRHSSLRSLDNLRRFRRCSIDSKQGHNIFYLCSMTYLSIRNNRGPSDNLIRCSTPEGNVCQVK